MKALKINHLAVLLCVVVLFALGFLWYGPLFGEKWMAMVGLTREGIEANPPGAGLWLTNFVSAIVPIYVLAWLCTKTNADTAMKGAMLGLIIAAAFTLLQTMNTNMFADRPYGLAWITGGYSVVAFTLSGLILGAWRKYTE